MKILAACTHSPAKAVTDWHVLSSARRLRPAGGDLDRQLVARHLVDRRLREITTTFKSAASEKHLCEPREIVASREQAAARGVPDPAIPIRHGQEHFLRR